MNSKEKAEELTLKYYKLGEHLYMPISFAKQCALIAVDEIIKEYGTYYKVEVDGKYVSYWKEVKQEIKKL
jgi:hypothetical protein